MVTAVYPSRLSFELEKILSSLHDQTWARTTESAIFQHAPLSTSTAVIKYHPPFNYSRRKPFANECKTYVHMHKHQSNRLHLPVPPLLCVADTPQVGTVLVTQKVGKDVRRDGDGGVWVGLQWIRQSDVEPVVEAARDSLLALHQCGVLLVDVQIDKLRMEQQRNGGWRAWWIGLELAEVFNGMRERENEMSSRMIEEIDDCERMFEKEYRECREVKENEEISKFLGRCCAVMTSIQWGQATPIEAIEENDEEEVWVDGVQMLDDFVWPQ